MPASADMPRTRATSPRDLLARVVRVPLPILLLVLELPLILNPGYFSHDELQWWARADVPSWRSLPWVPWLDVTPLQYRPLTFNLWLVLAHAFAATPRVMHLVFVLAGIANAWLLQRVLMGARLPARVAYAAALVFSLSPYAVYVQGWTGTLADLLALSCGLLAARSLQSVRTSRSTALHASVAALLVGIALMCKESAVVLPLLLALAAGRTEASIRATGLAVAFSAAVVAAYLMLRWPALSGVAEANPAYAWSVGNVPRRLVEYLLYPWTPPLFEIGPILAKSLPRLALAAAGVVALLASLATVGWRLPLLWLAAFATALAPVLVLPVSYNHYAYLASAIAVAIAAAAWPRLRPLPRSALVVLAATTIAHGVAVMSRIVSIGSVQRALYSDLLDRLETANAVLTIEAADPRDDWQVRRLLHDVDRYRSVTLAGRIRVLDASTAASEESSRRLWMGRDGHLHDDRAAAVAD